VTLKIHFSWLAFLLILGSAEQALPATLFVTSPQFGICVTSEDARYQYHWGALQPEAGRFSFSPLGQAPLAPRITVPQDALPGDLLRVSIEEPENLDSVTAQILGPKQQTLSRGIGFRPKAQQKDEWVILVGVPNETNPGSYTLSLTARAGARNVLNLSSLSVRARTFRFERIVMTPDMEKIQTSEDPRKIAETREFVGIVTTAHTDAVFELGTICNPLPDARRTSGY